MGTRERAPRRGTDPEPPGARAPRRSAKRPTVFVGHPGARIEARPWLHADNAALYAHLLRALEERGHPYRLGRVKRAPRRYDLVLAHHTTVTRPGVWNLKKGCLPDFMD